MCLGFTGNSDNPERDVPDERGIIAYKRNNDNAILHCNSDLVLGDLLVLPAKCFTKMTT